MAVGNAELASILDYCRSLIDVAEEIDSTRAEREREARIAQRQWDGPHSITFTSRFDSEVIDLGARARGLRVEADGWAGVWADTVNKINKERRQQAVDAISSARGVGESVVDVFVGDDSGEQVRDYELVPVPSASDRYAATGGLETF